MKQTSNRSRHSWHVHASLHPVSLMALLCAGVFLVAATISAFGDSYQVSATVPAAILGQAAFITDPVDGSTFTDQNYMIAGNCPASSYVTLFDNSQPDGTASCNNGAFQIATSFQIGDNQLSVQDYTVTNQPGPTSPSIDITYTPPVTPMPTQQPTPGPVADDPDILQVQQVDDGVSYVSQATVEETTDLPTFHGVTDPFATVTILVHTIVVTCTTTADSSGYWQCTLPIALPVGIHTVNISAVTTSGRKLVLPQFHIHVSGTTVAYQAPATPLQVISSYHYQAYEPNQLITAHLQLQGGSAPYIIIVRWGDNQTTHQTVAESGPLSLTHRYLGHGYGLQTYTATYTIIDSQGQSKTSQFITYIRNPDAPLLAASKPKSNHGVKAFLDSVHAWLWLLWPAYIIVILMLLSFYLGERKQYEDDQPVVKTRKHRPTHHSHHPA
jgi:hypothetical protein